MSHFVFHASLHNLALGYFSLAALIFDGLLIGLLIAMRTGKFEYIRRGLLIGLIVGLCLNLS